MYNVMSTRGSGAIKQVMNWFREVLRRTGEELDFCSMNIEQSMNNEQLLSPGISLEQENQG